MYNLADARSQLPILKDWTYLNTGTVGIMPAPVLEQLIALIAGYEHGGHTAQAHAVDGTEQSRARLAELLGVSPSDIALNRNATDGINTVAAGFRLSEGDEVITSNEEHPAMVIPWLAACDRAGATLRFVQVSPEPEEFRRNLEAVLSSATRAVAISHVSCETGTRIPVQIIRESVGPEVSILVDASQSVGQFQFDISALNANFVIGNGHKWLAGPKGTGFIWIDPSSIEQIPPVYFASDTLDPHWSRTHYQRDPGPGIKLSADASRFEFGTRAWHLHAGLAPAIDYQAGLGWSCIETHMARMAATLKDQLADIEGITVVSPLDWAQSSGLVTFSIEGHSGEDVSRILWNDYNIAQRRVEEPSSVRVSCAYFTNEQDIERLTRAVAEIAVQEA